MRLTPEQFAAHSKRVASLTSAYGDGYRTGLQRNQFGERTRMEGVASHTLCMNGRGGYSQEWERGYRDGFLGNEAKPKKGAPKGDKPRNKVVAIRVDDASHAKYLKLGGSQWFLAALEAAK